MTQRISFEKANKQMPPENVRLSLISVQNVKTIKAFLFRMKKNNQTNARTVSAACDVTLIVLA